MLANRIRKRDRYESLKLKDTQDPIACTDGGAAFCCSLIPRSVITRIGFLDERFPVFFNDGDFAQRMFKLGLKAYIVPHIQAFHYGGSSVKQLDHLSYTKEWVYGLRAFYLKHNGRLYAMAAGLILGTDLIYSLATTSYDILRGAKGPGEFYHPFRTFWEAMTYTPPNAAASSTADDT